MRLVVPALFEDRSGEGDLRAVQGAVARIAAPVETGNARFVVGAGDVKLAKLVADIAQRVHDVRERRPILQIPYQRQRLLHGRPRRDVVALKARGHPHAFERREDAHRLADLASERQPFLVPTACLGMVALPRGQHRRRVERPGVQLGVAAGRARRGTGRAGS